MIQQAETGNASAINVLFHFADILFDPAILSLLKKITPPTSNTYSYYNNTADNAYTQSYGGYYGYNSHYSPAVSTVAFDDLNKLMQMVAKSAIVVAHLVQTSRLTALANQMSFYSNSSKDLGKLC